MDLGELNFETITLSEVKYFNMKDHLELLGEISDRASKEFVLDKLLTKMENEWTDLRFELSTWRDTGIPIL